LGLRYNPTSKEGKEIEDGMTMDEKVVSRILSKVEIEPERGCYLYQGAKLRGTDYGVVHWFDEGEHTTAQTHKVVFEFFHGKLEKGQMVCHDCDVPNCVNPDHLWRGSAKKNAEDRANKGRNASAGYKWVLRGETLDELVMLYQHGWSVFHLAQHYGVSQTAVGKALKKMSVKTRPPGRPPGTRNGFRPTYPTMQERLAENLPLAA
jgi:hypothetical protein